ncbi:MAG: hypothetical protein QOH88_1581 [Verrucomicrobiota bacterium]|jgi:6-phosphogluconolactonase/glucosamine-6-phosphate isomerase/deaminase
MSTSRAKAAGLGLTLVAVAVGVGALIVGRLHQVGGLPPTYHAADHDPRLSQEAATARPLITALARYRAEHGQFPADVAVLGVASDGWIYAVQPSGYILSKKLGWDPTLHYRFEQGRARWVFEPGDGSPEREITL